MMRFVDRLRDIPDGFSSLLHGLTWDGGTRLRGRGVVPRPCGVCRAWTRGSAKFAYYIFVNTAVTTRVQVESRVCAACWRRHLDLEPAARQWREEQERQRFAENVRAYRRWLERAPRRPPATPQTTPDAPSAHRMPSRMPPRPGQEPGTARLEDLVLERTQWLDGDREHWIVDIDALAKDLALHDAGSTDAYVRGPHADDVRHGPRHPHADALHMVYGFDGYRDYYIGSAFRIDDSRILVAWRYENSANMYD